MAVHAVTVALLVFAAPLAVLTWTSLRSEERGELERAALAAAVHVGPQFTAGDPLDLPSTEPDTIVTVYDARGRRAGGPGPDTGGPLVAQAASGVVASDQAGGQLVVAVPVVSAEHVIGVVRAAAPVSLVWQRALLGWSILATLAAGALAVSVLIARRGARRLTEPLGKLSAVSARITDGDLAARAEPSAIPEINNVALAHNAMVDRLTHLLERETHFSADASHQLRTPLSALLLELDAARVTPPELLPPVLARTEEQIRGLAQAVDTILDLARKRPRHWLGTAPTQPLGQVVDAAGARWHGRLARAGRRLIAQTRPDIATHPVPAALVTQVLDVLTDNALRHGAGTVTISARDAAGTVAVDVSDEGTLRADADAVFARGASGGDGHGIGLALARTMSEACGGRLIATRRTPTTFTLYLPAADEA